MARPLVRGVLSFGLVAIPVEIHSATKDEHIPFNYLHAKCGARVRNRLFCPVCNIALERQDLVRGYEFTKGQYVPITEGELIAQIIRLGALYQAIKTGEDLLLQDR